MAPPRSRSAPSKRNAAPPNPNPDLHAAGDEFNLHLLHAASEGDLRLLKRLVWALDKSRWDPREVVEAAKEEGVGALHLAAINGSLPVCRYLVEELGVDVDAVDDEAQTPLLWAIHGGSMDTVSYLLDHGANPSKVDDQGLLGALHLAARTGSLPVCRYLVEELGVDVDAVDDEARTPLVWAMLGGSMDIISYLLDHGANPHKADDEGFTPLHHAAGIGDPEMMELLLAKGVYVDPVSVSGTPLHIAAFSGHDEAMKILLENNADCNKIVPGAETPLLVAITGSSVKCAKLLVEAGADVNDGLVTPLSAAANKGLTACSKCLLEAGANPDVPDPSGNMPIELAALNGTREDVQILFPVTSCIPTVHDWSIDGLMHHTKSVSMKQGEHSNARRIVELKSVGAKSIKRNDYFSAAIMYSVSGRFPIEIAAMNGSREDVEILFPVTYCIPTVPDWSIDGIIRHAAVSMKQAMEHDHHDATLFSKRSLCWLRMGDGHKALQDALACREMRPGWPKGCYRQGAALMLLKDYGGACNAFLDATKLDPWSRKIEAALRDMLHFF